ncbi:HAD-IA family hydrolase [Vibrio eleionomae]
MQYRKEDSLKDTILIDFDGVIRHWRSEVIEQVEAVEAAIDDDFIKCIRSMAPEARLVLVTNATSKLTNDLAKYDLIGKFDFVINSADIGVAKPEPEFFAKSVRLVNRKVADCVFIDDSVENVQSAQEVGIQSLHFKSVIKTLQFIKQHCIMQ